MKKKTKMNPSQVKQAKASAAANAIKRQAAIEESEQAASRLFDELRVFVFNQYSSSSTNIVNRAILYQGCILICNPFYNYIKEREKVTVTAKFKTVA